MGELIRAQTWPNLGSGMGGAVYLNHVLRDDYAAMVAGIQRWTGLGEAKNQTANKSNMNVVPFEQLLFPPRARLRKASAL